MSVVIPTRNRRTLLAEALRGALAQDAAAVEVIVVDDGSTDATPTWLAGLDDDRVRVITHDHSAGVSRARNAAVARARAPWLAFLDDDDLWAPFKLRAQLAALARDRARFAYGSAVIFGVGSGAREIVRAPRPGELPLALLSRNVVPGGCSNIVAETALVRQLGGFDERLSPLADWDLWIRLAHAARGAAVDDVLVGYRWHARGMVARGENDVVDELDYLARKHVGIERRYGIAPDFEAVYRSFARAQRRGDRRGRRWRAARLYLHSARCGRTTGDALRAGGTLLGERVMRIGGALLGTGRPPAMRLEAPAWLRPVLSGRSDELTW